MKLLQIKNKKGFSLLEMTISLVIISFVLLIFFNTIVTSLDISYKGVARSFVREEMTTMLNLITRDVRNSDEVLTCTQFSCEMELDGENVIWGLCKADGTPITPQSVRAETDIVCKKENGTSNILFRSDDKIKIEAFEFETAVSAGNFSTKTILITMVGSHKNSRLEVNNIIRQSSVSTRNYEF